MNNSAANNDRFIGVDNCDANSNEESSPAAKTNDRPTGLSLLSPRSQKNVTAMEPQRSMMVYPRLDTMFKTKRSFNFDMMKTKIYLDRYEPKSIPYYKAVVHWLIGISVGCVAFGM